jgi:hypothetical protein
MNAKVTKDLLVKEVNCKMEELEYLEPTSEEYKAAVEALTKLTDRILEFEKIELEELRIDVTDENEKTKLELEQIAEENNSKDNKIKNVLSALGIVIPAGLTIWGTFKSIKFEETGTITTMAGRNFINRLFKK